MKTIHLSGPRPELLEEVVKAYPQWGDVHRKVRQIVGPVNKKEVWEEQAALLGYAASQYNRKGALILEIGANRGYTAAVMQLAAPKARVETMEPHGLRRHITRQNLKPLGIKVRPEVSWRYLEISHDAYDMIFVDGDHARVRLDLPWFNRLKVGGLFIHHDYSAPGSSRECPPVYEALTEFGAHLGRQADVLMVDDTGVGIGGWYRLEGESWG